MAIIIEINGSPAESNLNGDGNVLVMVSDGGAAKLIYLRDILDGWQDNAKNWKLIAKRHPKYIETEARLKQQGGVYLGTCLAGTFMA